MTVAAYPAPLLTLKSWLSNGQPNAFGTIQTYQAGTTTPLATYTDWTASVQNANPLTLNARGECSAYLLPNVAYKFVESDSSGNLIKTTDQIIYAQLVALYAGVDTGVANAYVVSFSTPYTSYTNGWLLYFVPANSNTGASTLNVNGLGVTSIVNPNGSALSAGQLQGGALAQVVYLNGNFVLLSVGSTTGTGIGTFGASVSLASAATTDLGSTGSHTVQVTGNATIASLGSSATTAAPIYIVEFSGNAALTNSSSLALPNATNIQAIAGDAAIFEYLGGGEWECLGYFANTPSLLYAVVSTATTRAANTTPTADPALQITIPTPGFYSVEGWINDNTGSSAGGLNGGFAYSGSLFSGLWGMIGSGTDVTNVGLTAFGSYAELESAQASAGSMWFSGVLGAETTGTLSFNWAQNSSNATASLVGVGSWIRAERMSVYNGAFSPVTHIYNTASSGTETIPTGASTVVIEVWGASGGGCYASQSLGGGTFEGVGGAGGGYSKSSYSVVGHNGQTMGYVIGSPGTAGVSGAGGTGGASSASSGTFPITMMTSNGGSGGPTSGSTSSGGTASGGTISNTTGNQGGGSPIYNAGAGITGTYGTGNAGGAGGVVINGIGSSAGQAGGAGLVIFRYS